MDLICDFERYPEYVTSVLEAQILDWSDDHWRVAFEVALFRRRVSYTLDLDRPTGHELNWSLVEGDWMQQNEGGWRLVPLDENTTRATYTIRAAFRGAITTGMTSLLIDASIPRMLRDFKRHAEQQWQTRPQPSS